MRYTNFVDSLREIHRDKKWLWITMSVAVLVFMQEFYYEPRRNDQRRIKKALSTYVMLVEKAGKFLRS